MKHWIVFNQNAMKQGITTVNNISESKHNLSQESDNWLELLLGRLLLKICHFISSDGPWFRKMFYTFSDSLNPVLCTFQSLLFFWDTQSKSKGLVTSFAKLVTNSLNFATEALFTQTRPWDPLHLLPLSYFTIALFYRHFTFIRVKRTLILSNQ